MGKKPLIVRDETRENHITKVEITLLPKTHDKLEKKLRPFVNKKATGNESQLAEIVADCLGEDILRELKHLGQDDKGKSTVFVIHNLPEISDKKARKIFKDDVLYTKNLKDVEQNFYYYFMKGLAKNLALEEVHRPLNLVRRFDINESIPTGGDYHNHPVDVTALAGVVSDGAATRFLNLEALANDAEADKIIFNSTFKAHPPVSASHYKAHETLKTTISFKLADEAKDLDTVQKFSRDVIVGKGDVVLWLDAKNGYLQHKAIASKINNTVHSDKEILRIIGVLNYNSHEAQR